MTAPTKLSEEMFRSGQASITNAVLANKNDVALGFQLAGLSHLMEGLANLSVGVRATYILLEQVKNQLDKQAQARR